MSLLLVFAPPRTFGQCSPGIEGLPRWTAHLVFTNNQWLWKATLQISYLDASAEECASKVTVTGGTLLSSNISPPIISGGFLHFDCDFLQTPAASRLLVVTSWCSGCNETNVFDFPELARLTISRQDSDHVQICWDSPRAWYQVRAWDRGRVGEIVADNVARTGTTTCIIDTLSAERRFYIVQEQPDTDPPDSND